MVVPVISDLPPTPTRNDGAADFTPKADTMIGALQPMVAQVNIALQWMNGRLTDTQAAQAAAAASANAAAQSVIAATHQVELATAQVGLAAEQVGLAAAKANASAISAQLAKTYAEAVGAGAGIPLPVANRFLGTGSDSVPKWLEIEDPAILQVGQISISAAVQDATMILANGATRLQADFPELYAAIGANKVSPPITSVGVMPGGGSNGSLSPDAKYFAQVTQGNTDLRIYPRAGDGWGAVITFTLPAAVSDQRNSSGVYFCPKVTFNRDSTLLAVPLAASPFIAFYKRVGTVWTAIATPADIPAGQVNGISFTADGVYCALAVQASPQFIVYKRSGDAFAKLANPTSMPTAGLGTAISFTSDGLYLAVSLWNTGGAASMYIYKRSTDTLTKVTDPELLPSINAGCVAFSPDGLKLFVSAVGNIAGSGFSAGIYSRVGDVFTFNGYTSLGVANNVMFSLDGKYLVAAAQSDPAFTLYDVTAATPVSLGYFPVSSQSSGVATGVSIGYSGTTYMGLYLIATIDNNSGSVWLYRDGYTMNPNTEFKVPGLTIVNSLPTQDAATKFSNPQLAAYIKAKSA